MLLEICQSNIFYLKVFDNPKNVRNTHHKCSCWVKTSILQKRSDLNKSTYKHIIEIVIDVLNEEYQLESNCSINVLWQLICTIF